MFSFSLKDHSKDPDNVGVFDQSLEELYNRRNQNSLVVAQVKVNTYNTQVALNRDPEAPQCSCTDVLIVDDNEFNIYTLKLLLQMCGVTKPPDIAFNGQQAIT